MVKLLAALAALLIASEALAQGSAVTGTSVVNNPYVVSKVNAAGATLGLVDYVHKFGETGETAIGDAYDIWDCPSLNAAIPDLYPWDPAGVDTAFSLYAMSDDELDAGKVLIVQGLDENWEKQTEQVPLGADTGSGGTTAALVGSASGWKRVYRAYAATEGLVGNVYFDHEATDATGNGIPDDLSDLQACIKIGANQTLMTVYTTAEGYDTFLEKRCATGVDASPGNPGSAAIGAFVRLFGGVWRVQDVYGVHSNGTSVMCIEASIPYYLPPRTDIRGTIITDDGLDRVTGSFDLTEFSQ
jgi:hypothetical protein